MRSDKELVHDILQGNQHALETLLQRHELALRAFIARIAPRPQMLDDIAQETLIKAVKSLAKCQQPQRFAAWLRGVARHVVADHWRQLYKQQSVERDQLAAYIEELATESFEQDELEQARKVFLDACLQELNPKARSLIEMRFKSGLNCAQIAESLEVQASSVRSRLSRIYASVRRCIQQRELDQP